MSIWTVQTFLKGQSGHANNFHPLIHNNFWDICKKVKTVRCTILHFYGTHFHDLNRPNSLEGPKQAMGPNSMHWFFVDLKKLVKKRWTVGSLTHFLHTVEGSLNSAPFLFLYSCGAQNRDLNRRSSLKWPKRQWYQISSQTRILRYAKRYKTENL